MGGKQEEGVKGERLSVKEGQEGTVSSDRDEETVVYIKRENVCMNMYIIVYALPSMMRRQSLTVDTVSKRGSLSSCRSLL